MEPDFHPKKKLSGKKFLILAPPSFACDRVGGLCRFAADDF
jgi:hypothetical protein